MKYIRYVLLGVAVLGLLLVGTLPAVLAVVAAHKYGR